MAQPLPGTIAEAYLRSRGITALHGAGALRFHPRCYYRSGPALMNGPTRNQGRFPTQIS